MPADSALAFVQNFLSTFNSILYSGLVISAIKHKGKGGVERSAGIIFFRKTPKLRRYLVIRSSYHGKDGKHNFWDFPKGLLEKSEDGVTAAKREAVEEAGIGGFTIIPDFKETVRYFVRRDRDQKAPRLCAMSSQMFPT